MTAIVVDASVTAAWFLEDEQDSYATSVLRSMEGEVTAHVPSLWGYEFANVLTMAERRSRITESDAGRILMLMQSLSIEVDAAPTTGTLDKLVDIARHHGITAYDAAYLELAIRLDACLATLDQRLRAVAQGAGIPAA
ncbi:MAG: type II toxin-antitoxin system VapC family toxin [Gemmatimonadota bacterium]